MSAHDEVTGLVCRAGDSIVAVPLTCVRETMRMLPMSPIAGAPSGLLGETVVRGAATIVLDAGALVPDTGGPRGWTRLIAMRGGDRALALAVGSVIGVRGVPARGGASLLAEAPAELLGCLGALDRQLLGAAWVMPLARWNAGAPA